MNKVLSSIPRAETKKKRGEGGKRKEEAGEETQKGVGEEEERSSFCKILVKFHLA